MVVNIEVTTEDLRALVVEHVRKTTKFQVNAKDIKIQVMSPQNLDVREWEEGAFRAIVQYKVSANNV